MVFSVFQVARSLHCTHPQLLYTCPSQMHSIHILRWDRCSGGREEETQSLSFCCGHWSTPPDNFPVSNPLMVSSIPNEAWPLVSYATLWICMSSIPMDFWKPSLTWKISFLWEIPNKNQPPLLCRQMTWNHHPSSVSGGDALTCDTQLLCIQTMAHLLLAKNKCKICFLSPLFN